MDEQVLDSWRYPVIRGDISDVFKYFKVHHSEQELDLSIVAPKARSHRKEILNQ